MFDIHYHLLFGLDDGPENLDASLQLAEASIAEGVTHIVCTPHANERHKFDPEVNRERLKMLTDRLGDRITLGLGCDFHLSYENIEDLKTNRAKYTINGKRYLLVEFPDFGIPAAMTDIFFRLVATETIPIITHPERNPTLVADPRRMVDWVQGGCLVQVTGASLTGRFGKRAETTSHFLLKNNWVHFIASDAHSIDHRPPTMAPAHDILLARYGSETADRLCIHNPRAAFFGEAMPPQPEPIGLDDEPNPSHRGFFSRLFGR